MVQPAFAVWREEACLSTPMVWWRFTRAVPRLLGLSFGSRIWVAALAVLPFLAFGGGGASEVSGRQMLKVTRCREGDAIRILVENLEATEVTATFELGLVNLKGSADLPFTATFAPQRITEAFRLSPIRRDEEWSYTLTNSYTLGSTRAVHDDTFVYRLPYAAGRAFRVSQGYDSAFSHTGPERYAIDWEMPEGTPVLAARAGVVVATKDDSQKGGADRRFEGCANYVLIQHSDGTIGNYAHLLAHGVRVRVGQTVATGAVIALSGNTGFTSGAHLHFNVFKARNGKTRESIPTRFRTQEAEPAALVSGQIYQAPETVLAKAKSRTPTVAN